MFKLPTIDQLMADKKQLDELEEKCVAYDIKNRPTTRVKKTYVEACEEKGLDKELERTIKLTDEDYLRFLKANKHLELIDGVVVEKNIHGSDDGKEEFIMPPPNSLFMDN